MRDRAGHSADRPACGDAPSASYTLTPSMDEMPRGRYCAFFPVNESAVSMDPTALTLTIWRLVSEAVPHVKNAYTPFALTPPYDCPEVAPTKHDGSADVRIGPA